LTNELTVELAVRGPFDLAASTRFLEGFTPASRPDAGAEPSTLPLAFPAEGSWTAVGAHVRQRGQRVTADLRCPVAEAEAVAAQVARILSLDVDGSGFAAAGERDPAVAELQRRYPGLRPVLFHSPYEAACWTVIGHRIRIVQAAGIKQRLAERHGEVVEVGGRCLATFPAPARLRELDDIGLPPVKVERLHGLAEAALDGRLDAARLRAMEAPDALAELQRLAGIGPFSAELILIRGAGHPDVFPTSERRLFDEMAATYGLDEPDRDRLAAIADRWRPYRSWVALLFRTRREEETAEITTGRHGTRRP
jgi:3-methyladenine DNA glycosylase/8-oxoguanine DNA glycosylase